MGLGIDLIMELEGTAFDSFFWHFLFGEVGASFFIHAISQYYIDEHKITVNAKTEASCLMKFRHNNCSRRYRSGLKAICRW